MKHLKNKIKELLDLTQFKSNDIQLKQLKEFLKEEFLPDKKPLDISTNDLLQIRDLAIKNWLQMKNNTTMNSKLIIDNPDLYQAYCYFQAIYCFLRGKGLMFHDIRIGDQKDENERNKS